MRRFEHVRSVTVWLMLLGFLCGMLVPAVAMAKVHREIETEGDPTGGLGLTDGGGGWTAIFDGDTNSASSPDSDVSILFRGSDWMAFAEQFVVQAVWQDGKMVFVISFSEFFERDAGSK